MRILPSNRERVRLEIFKGVSGAQRTGSEGAALAVLSTAVITYVMYAMNANVFTGAMLGESSILLKRWKKFRQQVSLQTFLAATAS